MERVYVNSVWELCLGTLFVLPVSNYQQDRITLRRRSALIF